MIVKASRPGNCELMMSMKFCFSSTEYQSVDAEWGVRKGDVTVY